MIIHDIVTILVQLSNDSIDQRPTDSTRWIALYVLCVGMLMIILDATIVNVALPSIQSDLGFSQNSLAWVVNAYLIAFGGDMLSLITSMATVNIARTILVASMISVTHRIP